MTMWGTGVMLIYLTGVVPIQLTGTCRVSRGLYCAEQLRIPGLGSCRSGGGSCMIQGNTAGTTWLLRGSRRGSYVIGTDGISHTKNRGRRRISRKTYASVRR